MRALPKATVGKRRALDAGEAFDLVLGRVADAHAPNADWTETEPGFRQVVDELLRLTRRAKKRKLLTIVVTLALTGALVARQATNVRRYPARVVLGVTENSRLTEGPVETSNDLKAYVQSAVFTDSALLDVMKNNHYAPEKVRTRPRLALEDFREEVEVDVTKNEFAAPRTPGETRSALVAIELWLPDPEQAIDITRDLGDLVVERDQKNQLERLRLERGIAADAVGLARDEVDRLQIDRVRAKTQAENADESTAAELHVRIANDDRSLVAANQRLGEAEQRRRDLDTVGAASGKSVALRWDRVDWGATAIRANERASIFEVGIGGLLFLFPLTLLGVGAWNRRVYDDRDVRFLGLTALGVVQTGERST